MPSLTHILADVDLPKLDRPKLAMPELPSIDVGKTISDAVDAVHIGRDARRPRWPLAVGGVVVASLAGWAILSNAAIRARLTELADTIRQRFLSMRPARFEQAGMDPAEPIAFPAAETKPIEPAIASEYETPDAADYPPGLGSNAGDGSGAKGPRTLNRRGATSEVMGPKGLEPSTR